MLLKIHKENPQMRQIDQVVACLRRGGVVVIPTDTLYALACDMTKKKAFERMCKLKGVKPEKAVFSLLCKDLKDMGAYTTHVSTPVYKIIRKALPGPYTFILEASREVPRYVVSKRRTVGIRLPDHSVCAEITQQLGNPLLTSSLHDPDLEAEFLSDPELIFEQFNHEVDIVIDSGFGGITPSTVIDCSRGELEIEVVREGLGDPNIIE